MSERRSSTLNSSFLPARSSERRSSIVGTGGMDSIGEMWMNDETLVSPLIEDVNLDEVVDEWELSSSWVKIGRMDILHGRSRKH
jgi:hypothetical protein